MQHSNQLQVSICVPAYNEEKNISFILQALISQKENQIRIKKIIVVSSGSTDQTDEITLSFSKKDVRVLLIREAFRSGKAAAINTFIKQVNESVVVIESADTVPNENTIELLCLPFLQNQKIGLTGGAPIPVNDPETFIGYLVHTWWWFHRHIPRFGEIIAFRNILPEISATTAVDEAFIQAKLIRLGFKAVHIDHAIVRNKGPETVSDLIKQPRRIFNGHSRLYREEGIKIDNMTKSSVNLLLKFRAPSIKHYVWLLGGIAIEIFARTLGTYDVKVKKINPFIWDVASTTKHLEIHKESTSS